MKSPIQLPDLFQAEDIKWQDGASIPVHHSSHTAVLLEGKVYIGGGNEGPSSPSYRVDVYDVANNCWDPSSITTAYCDFAMTSLNERLIIAGGRDKRHKVTNSVFSVDDSELKNYTKMITPRALATAAGYQRTLIITGGERDRSKKVPSTELFDSSTGQWYTTDNLPLAHSRLQAVIVNNILYLLGGIDQGDSYSPTVFTASLDTLPSHTLKWDPHPDYSYFRSAPISAQNRNIVVVGGIVDIFDHHFASSRDVRMFDKVSQNWMFAGYIPSHRCASAAVFVGDNTIIVFGGLNDNNDSTDTVWIASC